MNPTTPTLHVYEWNSYCCNNSSDHRLVATFDSPKRAQAMKAELEKLFAEHADQVAEAIDANSKEWDPYDLAPSKAMVAFGAKYGAVFQQGIMWGDEGCSSEDKPEVATLGATLLLYHGYFSGGFGPSGMGDVLSKAGAKSVVMDSGPPWLRFEVEATPQKAEAVRAAILTIVEQREQHGNLCDFKVPWGELPIETTTDNIVFVPTEKGAIFTLAMGADSVACCIEWLKEHGAKNVTVELIDDAGIEALHKREVAAVSRDDGESGDDAGLFDPTGLSFVFTGKLASMTRAQAESRVSELGGQSASSVTKTLGVLVIGDDGSPLFGNGEKSTKQIKAEELIAKGSAIRVISETDFLKLKPGASAAPAPTPAVIATDIPRTPPTFRMVRDRAQAAAAKDTNYVRGIASDGQRLFISTSQKIWHSTDGLNWTVARNSADHSVWASTGGNSSRYVSGELGYSTMTFAGDTLWIGATSSILRTRDGVTFENIEGVKDVAYDPVGFNEEGVWFNGKGVVIVGPDGKLKPTKGVGADTINAGVATPFGMLFCSDKGNAYIGKKGALKKTPLRAKSPLYAICKTNSGAYMIVGHGNWAGAAYRTVDGKTFVEAKLPIRNQIHAIACLPDGRLITGGPEDTLMVSYDDGHSFEVIDHPYKGKSSGSDGNTAEYPRSFERLLPFQGGILATGAFQCTLHIT